MSHAPKHAMLIALEAGLLSEAGQRRAHAHLERCDVCRNARSGHARRVALNPLARALDVPAPRYDAMELVLRREARAVTLQQSRRTLWQTLAVAAALGLIVFGATRLSNVPTVATPTLPSAATGAAHGPPTDSAAATSAAVPGPTKADQSVPDTRGQTVTGAPAITQGSTLRAEGGELAITLWPGTGFVLAPGGEVRVEAYREHNVRLSLLRGSIDSHVAALTASDSYEIDVSEHRVAVRGTRFTVSRAMDARASVVLTEGKVEITRGAQAITTLLAPARWEQDVALDTTMAPNGTLGARDEGQVDLAGLKLSKRPREGESRGGGQVAPRAVQNLMARAAPLLRACHESAKRQHPDLPVSVELELSVAADGKVQDARVTSRGGAVPAALESCLRERALTFHIALQSAGPVRVKVPLQFSTGH